MATYKAQSPEGNIVQVNLHDGATDEEIIEAAKRQGGPPPGLTSPHMTSWSGGPESAKREGIGLLSVPLTAGGGQLASRVIPKLPLVSRLLGESAGSLGTKAIETGMEGRLPSGGEAGMAASFPAIGRAIGGGIGLAGKGLAKITPGRQFAMQEEAAQRLRDVPKLVKGEVSQPLYNQFDTMIKSQGPAAVPTTNLSARVEKGREDLTGLIASLRNQKLDKIADDLERIVAEQGTVPIDVLKKNLSRIGVLTRKGRDAGVEEGVLKQMYKGGKLDIEDLAGQGNQQASTLSRAMEAYKRERIRKDLSRIMEANVHSKKGFEYATPDTVMDVLRKPKIAETTLKELSPQEASAIMKELRTLSEVPALPGENNWWSWIRRAPGMMVGGALGSPAGVPGTVFGGLVGAQALDALEWVMKTDAGRSAIRRVLANRLGSGPLMGTAGAYIGHKND